MLNNGNHSSMHIAAETRQECATVNTRKLSSDNGDPDCSKDGGVPEVGARSAADSILSSQSEPEVTSDTNDGYSCYGNPGSLSNIARSECSEVGFESLLVVTYYILFSFDSVYT